MPILLVSAHVITKSEALSGWPFFLLPFFFSFLFFTFPTFPISFLIPIFSFLFSISVSISISFPFSYFLFHFLFRSISYFRGSLPITFHSRPYLLLSTLLSTLPTQLYRIGSSCSYYFPCVTALCWRRPCDSTCPPFINRRHSPVTKVLVYRVLLYLLDSSHLIISSLLLPQMSGPPPPNGPPDYDPNRPPYPPWNGQAQPVEDHQPHYQVCLDSISYFFFCAFFFFAFFSSTLLYSAMRPVRLCYVSCVFLYNQHANLHLPSLKYPPGSYPPPPPPDQDRAYYPSPQYPPPANMAAIHPQAQGHDAYRLPPPPAAYRPDPYGQQPPAQVVHYQAAAPRQRTAIACRYCRRRKVRAKKGFNPDISTRGLDFMDHGSQIFGLDFADKCHRQLFRSVALDSRTTPRVAVPTAPDSTRSACSLQSPRRPRPSSPHKSPTLIYAINSLMVEATIPE